MTAPKPLPEALRGRAFTPQQATRGGVGVERLRRRDLESPFWGVRAPHGTVTDAVGRCRAFATIHPGAVVVSPTAAVIWEMPLPRELEDDVRIHVVLPDGRRAARRAGVVGHHVARPLSVCRRRGILVPDAVETWLQLGSVLDVDDLIAAGDRLLHDRSPLATREQIEEGLRRWTGRRGARRLRAAYAEMRAGSRSRRETIVRLALIRAGVPEPELNAAIALPGQRTFHGDLVWRAQRLLVEYEGQQHRRDDQQWTRDLDRYNAFSRAGWIVIRVSRLMTPGAVAALVLEALQSRGSETAR